VALVAHAGGDRLVHIVVENTRHVGAVGIMAAGAICVDHRVIHVPVDERGSVRLVTAEAKDIYRFFQEKGSFG